MSNFELIGRSFLKTLWGCVLALVVCGVLVFLNYKYPVAYLGFWVVCFFLYVWFCVYRYMELCQRERK